MVINIYLSIKLTARPEDYQGDVLFYRYQPMDQNRLRSLLGANAFYLVHPKLLCLDALLFMLVVFIVNAAVDNALVGFKKRQLSIFSLQLNLLIPL